MFVVVKIGGRDSMKPIFALAYSELNLCFASCTNQGSEHEYQTSILPNQVSREINSTKIKQNLNSKN